MRGWCALGLVLCLLLCVGPARAAPPVCGPQALGVSRTIEIDPRSGARFGFQYNEASFLADGEVVLTFDDGPLRAYTRPILEALAQQCTKAVFFVVGRMAVADPEMVQEVARQGHTVGTHTWSHANLQALTTAGARAEIELGISAVRGALGRPMAPFFRFPYLRDTKWASDYLAGRQLATFSIDIDSKDYRSRDPSAVQRKVMADLARQRKGIILFHDIHYSTARALPGLLAELKAKGFKVVQLTAKAEVATVAEFDAQVQQDLARRRATVAAEPLARRSLTWPAARIIPAQPAAADLATPPPPSEATLPSFPGWLGQTQQHGWWPWR
ncbi:MAG TPA: polysaccharide deacetylase family protein [Hyphomicrobiaceae bacterium]|nr:polysaccharide deacetylase family protein [Hyphomicrobiaceae bacterium]